MHEMAVTESVLRIALQAGEKAGASRISAIRIRMGEYSDVVPSILKEYFAIAARGTIAEKAELMISRVPLTMQCRVCHWQGRVDRHDVRCGECGGRSLMILTGREFQVESLEAE